MCIAKYHLKIVVKPILRLSNTPKENCIIIEDSTNGIKAAHASGVFCVGYKSVNTKKQDYSLANIVIDRFEELDIENVLG